MHDYKTLRAVENSLFIDAFHGMAIIRFMDFLYEGIIQISNKH